MSVNQELEALKGILLSGEVGSQEAIKQKLAKLGFPLNQTKISRLLRRVGAVKMMNENKQMVYSLPHESFLPPSKNLLSELIIDMTHNGSLIVIHTTPGSASFVARSVDHHRDQLQILGTVAGDDTLFIAPRSVVTIDAIVAQLRAFLAGYP